MEEHFKNKLKNHKVDWDKEELLGNMEQELAKDKSRFNWKLLLLLPLFFLATCWGVYEAGIPFENKSDLASTENVGLPISKSENKKSNSFDSNQIDSEIKTGTSLISNSVLKNKRGKTTPSSLSKNNHNNSELRKNIPNPKSNLNSDSNLNHRSLTTFPNKRNSPVELGQSQNNSTNQESNKSPTISIAKNIKDRNLSSINEGQEKFEILELLPSLEMTAIPFDSKIQMISLSVVQDLLADQKDKSFESNLNQDTSKFKSSFYISGLVEAGLFHRTTNFQNNDLNFVNQLQANEKTETSKVLFSTNLSIGYLHQSGWSLQSGLQYQEIKEFLKYDHLKTETTVELNEKALYFLDQSGDTLFFSEPSSVINTEVRKVRHWNKHAYFSIPLEIGYHHRMGKVNLFGNLGISYAFAHKFKGRVNQLNIDGSNEIIDNPNFAFKNRIGVQLGLGVDYPLFKQTNIFIKMAYRRSPKLIGEWKEQFYQTYSLGAGVRVLIERNK